MFRYLAVAVALTTQVRADDAIAPGTITAVKKATVYVRVEGDGWGVSGSGFVVAADAGTLLVATNHHVAGPSPPAGTRPSAKATAATVVFDGGTPSERSYTAAVAAADPERDLAVLRVTGVADPPRPIAYTEPPPLVETMPVYTFGFPFGKALATGKGSPAVTVGKASVSSLRTGPDGELTFVQIDGNLNPGNSGGPVVDAAGRLVGVAVATIREGQGIGLTVPAAELARVMAGRPGRVRVTATKPAGGPVAVRVEADLIDPTNRVRGATAHYVVVPPKAKRPATAALDKLAGSTAVELKIDKGVASAEFTVPSTDGVVLVQVRAGEPATATRVRAFPLAGPPAAADLAGPPPAGWAEYAPRDKTFVMWVPEKPDRQDEKERNVALNGQRLRVNSVVGRTDDGLDYQAESVILPPTFARVARPELYKLFRGAIVSELKGRVTESKEATVGGQRGTEFAVEAGSEVTRARMLVSGSRVYVVMVTGAADQVAGPEAETILSAFRLPAGAVAKAEPKEAPPGPAVPVAPKPPATVRPARTQAAQRPGSKGGEPKILGGAFDPQFKDVAPEGGLLVGFELGLGKFFNWDVIQSARPIYRVGDAEVYGEQRGTNRSRLVTVKAKPGYAVGAVMAKHGLTFGGMSVTFMKVADGKLDPKDRYESDWVGLEEDKPLTKLGGDGTPVVGIVGKSNKKDMTGMGLLLKGQEGFEPAGKK